MPRLIDADELLNEMERDKEFRLVIPASKVRDAPTIDPESLRPHGRWVCVNAAYGRYECSVCHAADEDCSDYYAAHNVTAQDFCPYCGAKMDGGKTDDAK